MTSFKCKLNTSFKTNPPTIGQLQTSFNENVKIITQRLGDDSNALNNKLKSSRLPEYAYIYGAPKIHKEGCPLRPIVSSRKAPNKNLSIFYVLFDIKSSVPLQDLILMIHFPL